MINLGKSENYTSYTWMIDRNVWPDAPEKFNDQQRKMKNFIKEEYERKITGKRKK